MTDIHTLAGQLGWPVTRFSYQVPGEDRLTSTAVLSDTGLDKRPLVICLHGFPDNALSWRHQLAPLKAAGYRVICPMLPGYETSSLSHGGAYRSRYSLVAVVRRTQALIDSIAAYYGQQNLPVHLVGHDWGALTGYGLVQQTPARFRSFTALTIPYSLSLSQLVRKAPDYLRYAWYIQFFWLPAVPERVVPRKHWAFIDRLLRQWSPGWEMPAELRDSIKATLAAPGVLEAALGYYRAIPHPGRAGEASRKLMFSRLQVPCMQIQGDRDGCIPHSLWRLNQPDTFAAGLVINRLLAGHFPHQEDAETFNRLLLNYLSTR
ncbi:MAG: alpha/beta hydrolase [Marinobacter sp.]|nr:alpha/beta hydrolase [Marinobacter sp.]